MHFSEAPFSPPPNPFHLFRHFYIDRKMDSIESSKPALQSRRASSCQESSDSDNTLSMPEDVEKNITILNEKEEGKGGMSEGSELEEEVIWVTWEEGE